ncbi:MAG: hypothetical protein WAU96_07415, partial [Anaerolineae bacterium]
LQGFLCFANCLRNCFSIKTGLTQKLPLMRGMAHMGEACLAHMPKPSVYFIVFTKLTRLCVSPIQLDFLGLRLLAGRIINLSAQRGRLKN